MRIGIIGSSGGMGSFFFRYFTSKGHAVACYDIRKGSGGRNNRRSMKETVRDAEAVMIATPISTTVDVGRTVAELMNKGSYLIEISSIKSRILPKLTRIAAASGVKLISLHPLFGPSMETTERLKIAVVGPRTQVINAKIRQIFPDEQLIFMNLKTHEQFMGAMLTLTHAANVAFASTVAKEVEPAQLKKMASPISFVQLAVTEGVLSQRPELFSGIQLEDARSEGLIRSMISQLEVLANLVQNGDKAGLEDRFSMISSRYELNGSTARVYRAFKAMSDQ